MVWVYNNLKYQLSNCNLTKHHNFHSTRTMEIVKIGKSQFPVKQSKNKKKEEKTWFFLFLQNYFLVWKISDWVFRTPSINPLWASYDYEK